MKKREAVEVILAGRRAAARSGAEFHVDRERLGSIGRFNNIEIDKILTAVAMIEVRVDDILSGIDG